MCKYVYTKDMNTRIAEETVRMQLVLTKELKVQMVAVSKETGRNYSQIVREAMTHYFEALNVDKK